MSGVSRSSQRSRCASRCRTPLTLKVASLIGALYQRAQKIGMLLAFLSCTMDRELRLTVLRRATDIAGGPAALRERLNAEEHALQLWLAGRATVPDWVFLLAVDIVVRDDMARAAQDRRTSPRLNESQKEIPPS